jgi:RimJ/RimL family protein N-acetyltransferase
VQLVFPLRTERLTIRPLTFGDVSRHHEIFSNSDVVRYLYEGPLSLPAAQEHLTRRCSVDLPSMGGWLNLGVEVVGEGVLIGELGISLENEVHRQCEIGYVFDPAYSGHGYATEGAAQMVEIAFSVMGAHRVCGRLDARNNPSARLLERLGMRHEAHLRENEFVKGEWTDEAVYAVLEHEWRMLNGTAKSFALRV